MPSAPTGLCTGHASCEQLVAFGHGQPAHLCGSVTGCSLFTQPTCFIVSRLFSRDLLKGGLAIRKTALADVYTIHSALQCILQSANEPARQSPRLDVERRMHGIGIATAELVPGGTALMQTPLPSWRFDLRQCARCQSRRGTMLSDKITCHCRLSIVQASVALSASNAIVLAAPDTQLPCSIGNRDKSSIAICAFQRAMGHESVSRVDLRPQHHIVSKSDALGSAEALGVSCQPRSLARSAQQPESACLRICSCACREDGRLGDHHPSDYAVNLPASQIPCPAHPGTTMPHTTA